MLPDITTIFTTPLVKQENSCTAGLTRLLITSFYRKHSICHQLFQRTERSKFSF